MSVTPVTSNQAQSMEQGMELWQSSHLKASLFYMPLHPHRKHKGSESLRYKKRYFPDGTSVSNKLTHSVEHL